MRTFILISIAFVGLLAACSDYPEVVIPPTVDAAAPEYLVVPEAGPPCEKDCPPPQVVK